MRAREGGGREAEGGRERPQAAAQPGVHGALLSLQRSAGNAAVARIVRGRAPRAIVARTVTAGDVERAREYAAQIMSGRADVALRAFRDLAGWNQDDTAIALMRLFNDRNSEASQMARAYDAVSGARDVV